MGDLGTLPHLPEVHLGVASLTDRAPARVHTLLGHHRLPTHICLSPDAHPGQTLGPTHMCACVRHRARGRGGPGRGSCNDTHQTVVIATWTTSNRMPARHSRYLTNDAQNGPQRGRVADSTKGLPCTVTHILHPLQLPRAPTPPRPAPRKAIGGSAHRSATSSSAGPSPVMVEAEGQGDCA